LKPLILLLLAAILGGVCAAEEPSFANRDGYRFAESTLTLNEHRFRVWIYAPLEAVAGRKCIIVPPAGSPLIVGMDMGDGDQPEHIPYAKAGHFAVSFDIIGGKPDAATAAEAGKAVKLFFEAGMGVDQLPPIIAFIKDNLKQVDPKAIYVAGHSSAGTLALQASQWVDGLAGVMAYCPVTDIEQRISVKMQDAVKRMIPRFQGGIASMNPAAGCLNTKCPVFLFGSTGDSNVPVASVEAYAKRLTDAKMDVTLVKGTADHYPSMITEGIPAALAWLAR
jgi:dienelactone hydrolase